MAKSLDFQTKGFGHFYVRSQKSSMDFENGIDMPGREREERQEKELIISVLERKISLSHCLFT